MMVLRMWLTYYDHQFMTLIFCSYTAFGAQDKEHSSLVELES